MTTDTTTNPELVPSAPDEGVPLFDNYWGTDEVFRFTFPDGKQWVEIKALDEGGKSKFQKTTNKGIRVNQRTEDAHLDVDPAGERHALILASVTDFNIMQLTPGANPRHPDSWTRFPVGSNVARSLETWLQKANPKVVQDLEFFIRKNNPWMQADMTVEDIDKELDRLNELRVQVKEREEGEGGSANK